MKSEGPYAPRRPMPASMPCSLQAMRCLGDAGVEEDDNHNGQVPQLQGGSEGEPRMATMKPASLEEVCPSNLDIDALVKAACSAVENAIRKHYTLPKCLQPSPLALSRSGSSLSSFSTKQDSFYSTGKSFHECTGLFPKKGVPTRLLFKNRASLEKCKKATRKAKWVPTESTISDATGHTHWRVRLARIVKTDKYDQCLGLIVISNAIFLGISVETSSNKSSDKSQIMFIIGQVYSIFFFLELLFRITVLGFDFVNVGEREWNLFDVFIVSITTIQSTVDLILSEDGQLKQFRLLHSLRNIRALRGLRVFRTFRLFRPLRQLVTGILATLSSCFWAMTLLLSIIYLFSITFTDAASHETQEIGGDNCDGNDCTSHYFGSIFKTAGTLFQAICGGVSWGEPLRILGTLSTGPFCVVVFYVYICFAYFAVLNVVTALFCQFAIENSLTDQEIVIDSKLKENQYVRDNLQQLFTELDDMEQSDDSPEGMVTLADFEKFLTQHGVQARFSLLGIEHEDAWNLFKLLDEDGGGMLNSDEFIDGCLHLRGDAKRMDVSLLAYDIEASLKRLDLFMEYVIRKLGK